MAACESLRVVITRMTAADIDDVLLIEGQSFPTPWSRHAFQREVGENIFARYYVARKEGQVLGYAGMWLVVDEAHVTNIAISPDYRRQGFGQVLMQYLIAQAAQEGATYMTLEVRRGNHPAQSMYRGLGFRPVGTRKGYYSDTNEDAIIMEKDLYQDDSGPEFA